MEEVRYVESEEDEAFLQQLKSIVIGRETCFGKTIRAAKHEELREWILRKTSFLDDPRIELKTRIFWILTGMQDFKKCECCNGDLPHHWNVKNVKVGYLQKACSKECQYELAMKHSRETCLEKYGVEFSFQSENNKEKSRATCREKYGCDVASQSPEIKKKAVQTRLENNNGVYLTEEQLQKGIQTSLERYGVEHYQSTDECKMKSQQTSLEKHGVTHPSKDPSVAKKMVETKRSKNNGKYKSEEEVQKTQNTCLERYGVRNTFCAESPFRDKADQTKLEKYGNKNYNNRKQAEETCLQRYGVSSISEAFRHEAMLSKMTHNYNNLLANRYVIPMFSLDDYLNKEEDTVFKWKCLECGSEFESKINWNTRFCCGEDAIVLGRCLKCHPMCSGTSKEEQEFIAEIKKIYSGEVQERRDVLEHGSSKREWLQIDCYLPELKVGFEYDGIYYHSLSSDTDDSCKHLLKTQLAEDQGIKLVHIRSDKWMEDRDGVLQLCRDIIEDQVDFSKVCDLESNEIEVDRATFNKCFKIPGFHLVGETAPEKITVMTAQRNYLYEECGKLIYRKDRKARESGTISL